MARQSAEEKAAAERQATADKVTEQATETVENADNSGGDVFGATQDPSPALQTTAVQTAESEVTGEAPETDTKAVVSGPNGTFTFVPSKGGYSE